MSSRVDKRAVVQKIRAALAREIEVLVASAASAREGATHDEARPESDKDTRGLEASYLAGAQARRAHDLEKAAVGLGFLELRSFEPGDPVALSALVELELDGVRQRYFLANAGGGLKIEVGGIEVQVVTPEAPLGRVLLGKRAGEVVELRVQRETREHEIVAVR